MTSEEVRRLLFVVVVVVVVCCSDHSFSENTSFLSSFSFFFSFIFPQLCIGLKRLCSLHVTEREVEIIMNTMDTSQTGDVSLEEFTTCKKILAYFDRYFFSF